MTYTIAGVLSYGLAVWSGVGLWWSALISTLVFLAVWAGEVSWRERPKWLRRRTPDGPLDPTLAITKGMCPDCRASAFLVDQRRPDHSQYVSCSQCGLGLRLQWDEEGAFIEAKRLV